MHPKLQGKKIAIFHHFFKGDCKGGGEKLALDIREYYKADLWVGGIDLDQWGKHMTEKDKEFAGRVWDSRFGFTYLHTESTLPFWRHLKRQLAFAFSPKIKQLNQYDIVIFSYGNIAFVQNRISNPEVKKVGYINSPPRPFTDQFANTLSKVPSLLHPLVKLFQKWVFYQWTKDFRILNWTISNSFNIQKRIKKYLNLDTDSVIFPAVNTHKFSFLGQKNYYHSPSRLEKMKRIDLIVEAFAKMPDKKLVITSGGPLAGWIQEQITTQSLTNIDFRGRVSDEDLVQIMGSSIAGITIPVDEDAGITQIEIMAAGKPVIGVAEGGLLETVIDGETGILLPESPSVDDIIAAVNQIDAKKALAMKDKALEQAQKFAKEVFFEKLDTELVNLFD